MWKSVIIACLAIALAAEAAFAFDGRSWRHDSRGGTQSAQEDYRTPFVKPRAPRHQTSPGSGGRNRAREGVRRGEIVSLDRVMNVVQRRYRGRVLNVRLDGRRLIYHLRVLTRRGRVLRIKVNARNAAIISVRGDRKRRKRRRRN
jgi:uncharacterized membrane protein YkoI